MGLLDRIVERRPGCGDPDPLSRRRRLPSEGVQKFLYPDQLGVGRFAKIGIPMPGVMGPFVGVVEIVCGTMFLLGFLTRVAAIPLIIDMLVAIASTKIPILAAKGFWAMAHEARTDYSMLLGSIFLLITGAGPWSADARLGSRHERGARTRVSPGQSRP